MGAPSVAVPEVGVNIGGSIADTDTGVCSVSDEEGVPLAASLDVDILTLAPLSKSLTTKFSEGLMYLRSVFSFVPLTCGSHSI